MAITPVASAKPEAGEAGIPVGYGQTGHPVCLQVANPTSDIAAVGAILPIVEQPAIADPSHASDVGSDAGSEAAVGQSIDPNAQQFVEPAVEQCVEPAVEQHAEPVVTTSHSRALQRVVDVIMQEAHCPPAYEQECNAFVATGKVALGDKPLVSEKEHDLAAWRAIAEVHRMMCVAYNQFKYWLLSVIACKMARVSHVTCEKSYLELHAHGLFDRAGIG